mmetsp:Transcript_24810/g.33210  ORF Transcript_24810/g.33210 Transcript_24810/m.33210 type:complete len:87 (+) Transcript_24810:1125-1385(+)
MAHSAQIATAIGSSTVAHSFVNAQLPQLHHAKSLGTQREDCVGPETASNGGGASHATGNKRARLADNSSMADVPNSGKREMEMEVD